MSSKTCMVQKHRVRQQITELELENPQISVQKSVYFMQKLTVIAVSAITYLRDIFPSIAFKERKVKGMRVRVLRGLDDIPGTTTLIRWMKSAFQAVEDHVLKKMILVIQKQNCNTTLEIYTFTFHYNKEEIKMYIQNEKNGKDIMVEAKDCKEMPRDIEKSTRQLIHTILTLTTVLEPLPDNCEVGMRLEFNDDVPEDYELECFKTADSLGLQFTDKTENLKLGRVESRFATLAATAKTTFLTRGKDENDESEDDLVNPSQTMSEHITSFTSPKESIVTQQLDNKPTTVPSVISDDSTHLSEGITSVNLADKVIDDSTHLSKGITSVNLADKVIECICKSSADSGAVIKCDSCNSYQHKACYKLHEDQEVERHICVNCHEPNNPMTTCTDPELVNDKMQKEAALYRRALVLCLNTFRVSSNTFVSHLHLPRQIAVQIFNKLDKDGCLRPTYGKGNVRAVNTEYLKNHVLDLHFGNSLNKSDDVEMDTEENPMLDCTSKDNERTRRNKRTLQDEPSNSEEIYEGSRQKRSKYALNGEANILT